VRQTSTQPGSRITTQPGSESLPSVENPSGSDRRSPTHSAQDKPEALAIIIIIVIIVIIVIIIII
jgi:hypothetical protein